MKRWGWVCVAVLLLVLGQVLTSGAQGAKDEDLTKTLVSQSPWKGKWSGLTYPSRSIAGTFELVFKMEDGAISAVIQNVSGSATVTKLDSPITDIKIKGNRIELKTLPEIGITYELKLDKEGKLVGLLYTPRLGGPYDVEFRPAKR